jgi:outer membrane protein OmpA-like peptidoglycan-associated protein
VHHRKIGLPRKRGSGLKYEVHNSDLTLLGFSDNQGAVDANLSLSLRRAQAVAAALVSRHGIDAKRLDARGSASFSPVASNAREDGRSRNRRVELVLQ